MEISYIALENSLKLFLKHLEGQGLPQDYALFHSLYTFGFRIQELATCEKWERETKTEISCQPSKQSNRRFIAVEKAHPLLIESIETRKNLVYISSYSTYRRIFESRIKGLGYQFGRKKCSTHLFRHVLAKRLFKQGKTGDEIQKYLGIKSLSVTMGYVNSRIQAIQK